MPTKVASNFRVVEQPHVVEADAAEAEAALSALLDDEAAKL
jgi:hypothetical protein